jgi:AcrR family transcriptional regulator
MTKIDRRIRRTRRLLGEALIELILEKGFDAVTIRDITERADVAYATFFRHYEGKEELLIQQMEAAMQELEGMALETEKDFFRAEGKLLFQFAESKEALLSSLLGRKGHRYVVQRLKDMIIQNIHSRATARYEKLDQPAIPFDVLQNHIAAATLELIAWWLENNKPLPPEEMADIYEQLVIKAAWQAAKSIDE